MKRVFSFTFMFLLISVPALAYDLQVGVEQLLDDTVNGLIKILGIIILALVTNLAHKITKKYKLEQYNAQIDAAITNGVLYAEEYGRKKAKDTGVTMSGAEKFAKAYQKAAEKLPFLESDTIKEQLVVKLADLRTQGLDRLEQEVRDRLPQIDG
jgi:hypothetical protein